MLAILLMPQTDSPFLLGVLLLVEGVASGMFLTAGPAYITEHSTPTMRGSAIGVYSTAGSLGSTFSPVLLGIVAEYSGVQIAFRVTGVLIFTGLLMMVWLIWKNSVRSTRP